VIGERYLLIRYRGGEPEIVACARYLEEILNKARELLERGERLVSIEILESKELEGHRGSNPSL